MLCSPFCIERTLSGYSAERTGPIEIPVLAMKIAVLRAARQLELSSRSHFL